MTQSLNPVRGTSPRRECRRARPEGQKGLIKLRGRNGKRAQQCRAMNLIKRKVCGRNGKKLFVETTG